jgi:putative membrane protein
MTGETKTRLVRALVALLITAALVAGLFLWQPSGLYLWLKAIHVMAVISWMAGMFYLPRLFVYHCGAAPGSDKSETFKLMERRLLHIITNPAMVVSWATGLWLVWDGGYTASAWLHGKLVLALLLSAAHGLFARWTRDFAADRNQHSGKFYRVVNEVPTVLMIGMVILVVLKPS